MRWLGAPGEELPRHCVRSISVRRPMGVTHLVAVADELLRNVDELLELVRHGGGRYRERYRGYFCGERERCCWRMCTRCRRRVTPLITRHSVAKTGAWDAHLTAPTSSLLPPATLSICALRVAGRCAGMIHSRASHVYSPDVVVSAV